MEVDEGVQDGTSADCSEVEAVPVADRPWLNVEGKNTDHPSQGTTEPLPTYVVDQQGPGRKPNHHVVDTPAHYP